MKKHQTAGGNNRLKWLAIGLAAFLAAAALTALGAYVWMQRTIAESQPPTDGILPVKGLSEAVEIIRDDFGVPHIYAQSAEDLYFAFGFAMAQDRLWQMEVHRRLGSGRLSEILGAEALSVDRYFRTLAVGGRKPGFPKEMTFIVDAFARGVNACIEERRDRLPLEFRLLGFQPEPWRAEDTLAVYRVVCWGLSFGWRVDLTAGAILAKVGQERFREAFALDSAGTATIAAVWPAADATPLRRVTTEVARLTGFTPSAASNNWVVSAEKSASGRPLLANDTHMPLTNPSLWWEVHLVGPGINAVGFAIPGLPGIPAGHNLNVAWGITNVMADDVDFFVEELNPANPIRYRVEDRWEEMRIVRETLRIKGAAPQHIDIRITRHGPIIGESDGKSPQRATAARWAFGDAVVPLRTVHRLLSAGTVADVTAAIADWQMPGQNFVFADTIGNIGYWCCAAIPIRLRGDGLLPVDGRLEANDWNGYVSFEQLPHLLNPPEGFIASANNPVVGADFPYAIGNYWEPPDRFERIAGRLQAGTGLSVADMQALQQDVTCLLAAELTPLLVEALAVQPATSGSAEIARVLKNWDFRMTSDSPAAAVFEASYHRLLENIFMDELGRELYREYLDMVMFAPRALRRILREGHSPWLDDVHTPSTETLPELVANSLRQALADLSDRLGKERSKWSWGRLHPLTFRHLLGERNVLDRIFNLGPYPAPGNHLTVFKTQYAYTAPFAVRDGSSMRMIVDLARPETALHVLPTGQSGLLGNAHQTDQIARYLNGSYREMQMDRDAVERIRESRLLLEPVVGSGGG